MTFHKSRAVQVAAAAGIGVLIYFTSLNIGIDALNAASAFKPYDGRAQLHVAISIAFLGGVGFSAFARRFIAWLAT